MITIEIEHLQSIDLSLNEGLINENNTIMKCTASITMNDGLVTGVTKIR